MTEITVARDCLSIRADRGKLRLAVPTGLLFAGLIQ
jgi:hypothetical protein